MEQAVLDVFYSECRNTTLANPVTCTAPTAGAGVECDSSGWLAFTLVGSSDDARRGRS